MKTAAELLVSELAMVDECPVRAMYDPVVAHAAIEVLNRFTARARALGENTDEHPAVAHLRVYLGMMEDGGHRITADGQCTEHGEYECWCALAARIVRAG